MQNSKFKPFWNHHRLVPLLRLQNLQAELLALDDVELMTPLKKNMKPRVLAAFDKLLLRKRCIIETINDQLKNIFDLEHSRHRSLTHYMINVVAGLVAYS